MHFLRGRRAEVPPDPADLVRQERSKYEKMWEHGIYRWEFEQTRQTEEFLDRVGIKAGMSVADFGCGTGHAIRVCLDRGVKVVAVDIAENALPQELRNKVQFYCTPIWDVPAEIDTDYGLCTDVMEHIPPSRVDGTLESIRRSVRGEVLFDISLRHDRCGTLTGEILHLSVQPVDWWKSRLEIYWSSAVIISHKKKSAVSFLASP